MNGLSFREFLNIETGKTFNNYKLEDIIEHHQEITHNILKTGIKPQNISKNYLIMVTILFT